MSEATFRHSPGGGGGGWKVNSLIRSDPGCEEIQWPQNTKSNFLCYLTQWDMELQCLCHLWACF